MIILEDVSLTMHSGKICGLQGSNGCRKDDADACHLRADPPGQRKRIRLREGSGEGYGFPGEYRYPDRVSGIPERIHRTAEPEYLADIQKRVGREEVRQTLTRVVLIPDDKRKFRKYSLGMKQRLGIAAAIMEKNEILLIDEPFNALDVDGIELVKNIRGKNGSAAR